MNINTQFSESAMSVTLREMQVLSCMARGNSSKQIADDLFISEHTVISHRKNLLRKLDARNTAHLIFKGVRHGLIL